MIEQIQSHELETLQGFLSTAESVVIGTHLNPDGDALGSALAVAHYLDGLSIPYEVVCHHPVPKNLRFLPGAARVSTVANQKHSLGIVVDLDAFDRLGSTEPYFHACDHIVVVDHHVPIEAPGDLRIVDTDAPATSLILTRLFRSLGAVITPAMATCLFTGLTTDTGSFRFRNTNPEAFDVGGYLLDCGADLELIAQEVFMNRPLEATRLLGHMLSTLQLEADGQICWSLILQEDFQKFGASDEQTDGFVNELLAVDTVKIAVLARETKPNSVRYSLRSRKGLDVAKVAQEFGGGGHVNASGLSIKGEAPRVGMARVIQSLKKCLE